MMAEFIETTLMDGFADGPHVTEVQIGLANQAVIGPDDYVLEGGRESEAQILTNNSIRIFDGVYCIQGRRDVIPANGYTDVTIANGSQSMNRNDIIVRRYKKDESSEIETTEYAVIKGTPSSGTAVDPEVTIGDIRSGATLHEMTLYRVKLTGLNITAVEPMFNILKNMASLQKELAELNSKTIQIIKNNTDYQIYTLCGGKIKIVSGSIVKEVQGTDYVRLFDTNKIAEFFGDSYSTTRLNINTYNGDNEATNTRFLGAEIWQGHLYQYFSQKLSCSVRINYRMVYIYP